MLFALVTSGVVIVGVPGRPSEPGLLRRVVDAGAERPLATVTVAVLLGVALIVVARLGHDRIARLAHQLRAELAILRSPARYLRLLFLPALGSYLLRCAAYAVLLAACDIPVTVWTVALALGSNALAGAVRLTPGGIGTTQAIDIVALYAYAPPEVVTAYSLAELALTGIVSLGVAVGAIGSLAGWQGTRRLLGHLGRGEMAAGLRAIGIRHRLARTRLPRWRARGRH